MSTTIPSLWRPLYHHTPADGWMNDPVGLIRWRGQWRMSFIRADENTGVASSWGHAVSDDLLTWVEAGIALQGDEGSYIYSGSMVAHGTEALAYFTRHDPGAMRQHQHLARSSGDLSHWALDSANPLIDEDRRDSRDPFVFQFGDGWRMLLAEPVGWHSASEGRSRLMLFASVDMTTWCPMGPFGPLAPAELMYECPSLIRLRDEKEGSHWLLMVSIVDRRNDRALCSTIGWLGSFDGDQFSASGDARSMDFGPDFYAAAPWANIGEDAPVIVAWMNSWAYARGLPCEGWSGGPHSLPRRLSLTREPGGDLRVRQSPAALPPTVPPTRYGEASVQLPLARGCLWRVRAPVLTSGQMITVSLDLGGDEYLSLIIEPDTFRLSRDGPAAASLERGFAGVWTSDRSNDAAVDVTFVVDGCAFEMFDSIEGIAASALMLRKDRGAMSLTSLGTQPILDFAEFL